MILGGTNNVLHFSVTKRFVHSVESEISEKSCNNINNSCAQVSRPCYFLWLWLYILLNKIFVRRLLWYAGQQAEIFWAITYSSILKQVFYKQTCYKWQNQKWNWNETWTKHQAWQKSMTSSKTFGSDVITWKYDVIYEYLVWWTSKVRILAEYNSLYSIATIQNSRILPVIFSWVMCLIRCSTIKICWCQ